MRAAGNPVRRSPHTCRYSAAKEDHLEDFEPLLLGLSRRARCARPAACKAARNPTRESSTTVPLAYQGSARCRSHVVDAGPATPLSEGDLAALPNPACRAVGCGQLDFGFCRRSEIDVTNSETVGSQFLSLRQVDPARLLSSWEMVGQKALIWQGFAENLCTSGTRSRPNCLLSPPYSPNLRTPAKKCRGSQLDGIGP